MSAHTWDVVIVGAGASGLSAARELATRGRSVLLLEARNRIGGRIWTRQEPGSPVPIELGAEFIHGESPESCALLQEIGSEALHTRGADWTLLNGRPQPRTEDLFGQVQAALSALDLSLPSASPASIAGPADMPFETFLTEYGRRGLLSPAAQELARRFVQGFDAADPALVSTRSIAAEWGTGGMLDAPQFRPYGGYRAVLDALTRALDRDEVRIQLQTTVRTVRWQRGQVELAGSSAGEPFRVSASKVLITVPIGVLQLPQDSPDALEFVPPLTAKQVALEGIVPGAVLKVVLRLRTAFWEDIDNRRFRNTAFFHSPNTAFQTFWTSVPLPSPVITAWMGGPPAAQICARPDADIIHIALRSFREMFGAQAPESAFDLEAAHLHNWEKDPFARGAYSYVTTGHNEDARQNLAAPLLDTLFFAGEATDTTGEPATVTGALRSGKRAAREIAR